MNLNDLRKEYKLKSLERDSLNPDPFVQFNRWLEEAIKSEALEPNAISLATASPRGRPSNRTVLLKGIDEKGFLFFTNYESRKGTDLAFNPFASMAVYWRELERQVLIDGPVEKLSQDESEAYFSKRPRESRLGTWASHQDQIILSRKVLEKAYSQFERKFKEKDIPLPPYWGGYRLLPDRFEFWQGRANRLHDRFCYELKENHWHVDRLAP